MKLAHLIAALLLAGTCRVQSAAPQKSAAKIDPEGLAKLLEPVVASGMKKENISGAVFILVKDGRVVMAKGYGVADLASGRRVDPATTIFPTASISKVFTATAVMQLVDIGRLDLQTDVNRYLTSLQVPNTYPEPITTGEATAQESPASQTKPQ